MLETRQRRTGRARTVRGSLLALVLAGTATLVWVGSSPAQAAGTVTVTLTGQGSVTGVGIDCTHAGGPDCSQFYADDTYQDCDPDWHPPCIVVSEPPEVTFTAGADTNGYVYDGWSGCDGVTGRECSLTVASSTTVTAHYRDAQAPSVVADAPAGAQRGRVVLSATASDNSGSVAKVDFRVGDTVVVTDLSAPFSVSIDTTTVADGTHHVTAKAYDHTGLSTTSAADQLVVDNTAPGLVLTGAPEAVIPGNSAAQWTWSVSDASDVTTECSLVPQGTDPSYAACSGHAGHAALDLPAGVWSFAVRGTDEAGNQSVRSGQVTVDELAPRIRRAGPTGRTKDRRPRLRATVTDVVVPGQAGPLTSADLTLRLDGRRVGVSFDPETGLLKARPARKLSRGKHRVLLVAVDAVGNRTERAWSFKVVR